MKIMCPFGLHEGLFQSLDANLCQHQFYVKHWRSEILKDKPDNVIVASETELNAVDNYDAVLVLDAKDYESIKHIQKPIILYQLVTSRGWNYKQIYANPNVIPIFDACTTRVTHAVFDGLHKTIVPGIDCERVKGWDIANTEKRIIYAKNNYQKQDPLKYETFRYICGDYPSLLVGKDGDLSTDDDGLIAEMKKSRLYVNIEPRLSTMSVSMLEAMALGMPVVCNDTEAWGEVIRNGFNGYISNSSDYLKKKVEELMNDDEAAVKLGQNARKTIQLLFSKEIFNFELNDFLNNLQFYNRTTWRHAGE